MSGLGRALSLFPAAVVLLALACAGWFAASPGPLPVLALLATVYGLPLLAFRLLTRVHPLDPGASYLVGNGFSAWWGTHQLQLVYMAVPQLEALLRLIPGVYSAWLRLWGSRVGRDVYWTPLVDISDRSLMRIGDRVIFGHRCGAFAHIIKPTRANLLLYVKPIVLEDDVFIGAGANLGPGVRVTAGKMIAATETILPNRVVE